MKPVIAIDIDDVLSTHAADMVTYSNKVWGTNLTVDNYDEHWAEMWQTDMAETERRAVEYHASGVIGRYGYRPEAIPVLEQLKKQFDLQIVTSRRTIINAETMAWLERYFKGLFSNVHHAGMWDVAGEGRHLATKAEVVGKVGARYLIDDQLKHCTACAERGVQTVLFGNYTWNQAERLPKNVTRCKDWAAVLEYFDGRN